MKPMTTKRRFLAKVALPNDNGCALWLGAVSANGYGNFWDGQRQIVPHRFAYELWVGSIPEGLHLDHLCRVRRCVAPDHLEPVTCRVNSLRGVSPAAESARKTHCQKGHPLGGDNVEPWYASRGWRRCLTCARERNREHARRYAARRRSGGVR